MIINIETKKMGENKTNKRTRNWTSKKDKIGIYNL